MNAFPIVLGTAGHIDHGKTALVRALTGIDTDRLKEEKERGITTELGFAHLTIGDQQYGFVDVPGHERFIRAMVSGATGLDLVCLVVAADEGIMPQTREHLDICQLLGVRTGFVALTKSDLVTDDWVEMVSEELRETLGETFLAQAPIVPCSARTGAGLEEVKKTIVELAAKIPRRGTEGTFRLPIDRVFTIKGFGTVVTGTIFDGNIGVRDDVVVLPRDTPCKVRGLQVHGEQVEDAAAGMRCAVNLGGATATEVHRGDVLAHPGGVVPSHILDVQLSYLRTSREPLRTRQRVLIHHATTQVLGSVTLLDAAALNPGDVGLAQLRIDRNTPISAVPGDRFLLRGFVAQEHYGTTIGGGEILRVQAAKLRPRDVDTDELEELTRVDARGRLLHEVSRASHRGLNREELSQRVGIAVAELDPLLDPLIEHGDLVSASQVEGAETIISPEVIAVLEQKALEHVTEHREKNEAAEGMPRAELRSKMPKSMTAATFELVVEALVRRGALEAHGSVVRRPEPKVELSTFARTLGQKFQEWGVTPPRPAQLPDETSKDRKATDAAAAELLRAGILTKVKADLYVHSDTIASLKHALESHLDEHGSITPAQWKQLTGASRKYSIPLAEHFDQIKLTLRVGDVRKRRG